ncbi:MAG: hypothetical protein Q8Q06_04805 [bacterium]|nr:hypothetical protein [bacterium]
MKDLLKGNYKVPPAKETDESKESAVSSEETLEEKFEAAALKKLGGSITFVKKKKTPFVWGGNEDKKNE